MARLKIGKQITATARWLGETWLEEGPIVCFLQGEPGVGKTELAIELVEHVRRHPDWKAGFIHEIPASDAPNELEIFTELIAACARKLPDSPLAGTRCSNLDEVNECLEALLSEPILLIIDEAQRLFRHGTGFPLPSLSFVISHLRTKQDLPGRLLLISNIAVERGRWAESTQQRRVDKLEIDEALDFFKTKTNDDDFYQDIPESKLTDVLLFLDCNPRAIEALISALAFETIDEILSNIPTSWALHDATISTQLLRSLERDLWTRTLDHMEETDRNALRLLAVYRTSFEKPALRLLIKDETQAASFSRNLISSFMVNFRSGYLSLNPVVREILLAQLRDNGRTYRQAHSLAADYYYRPFRARKFVTTAGAIEGSFAELRYHLTHSERLSDLKQVVMRVGDDLKTIFDLGEAPPTEPEALEERIALLAVLSEHSNDGLLNYNFGKCLLARGRESDVGQALEAMEEGLAFDKNPHHWLDYLKVCQKFRDRAYYLQKAHAAVDAVPDSEPVQSLMAGLILETEGLDAAVLHFKKSFKSVPPEKNLFALYLKCADLLRNNGRTEECIEILEDGIKNIPFNNGSAHLYMRLADIRVFQKENQAALDILTDVRKLHLEGVLDESIILKIVDIYDKLNKKEQCARILKEEIKRTPQKSSLYLRLAAYIKYDLDATAGLLEQAIRAIPANGQAAEVYIMQAKTLIKLKRQREAVDLLKEGIARLPPESVSQMYVLCADALAATNRSDQALSLVREGLEKVPTESGLNDLYVKCAELLTDADRSADAIALLREGINRIPGQSAHALYLLAIQVSQRTGNIPEATELLQQAVESVPAGHGLVHILKLGASLLCDAGRVADARKLMEDERDSFENDGDRNVWAVAYAKVIALHDGPRSAIEFLKSRYDARGHSPADYILSYLLTFMCKYDKGLDAIELLLQLTSSLPPSKRRTKYIWYICRLCVALNTDIGFSSLLGEKDTPFQLQDDERNIVLAMKMQQENDWIGAERLAKSNLADQGDESLAIEVAGMIAREKFNLAFDALEKKGTTAKWSAWLRAYIKLKLGDIGGSKKILAQVVSRNKDVPKKPDLKWFVDFWLEEEHLFSTGSMSMVFPKLPSFISGQPDTLYHFNLSRLEGGELTAGAPAAHPHHGDSIYVSYAWGEDSTPEGRQREDIVDRLCMAIEATGRDIGRDKTRLRAGDSIERFGHEIARARRVVAVISAKYLRSEYCMVYELFAAYQRCGFQKEEFREKVIALTLTDAFSDLRSISSVTDLKAEWQARYQSDIDKFGDSKSFETLARLTRMKEMIDRLHDMIGCVQDTVMSRGFDDIVRNNFKDVLVRLQTPRI